MKLLIRTYSGFIFLTHKRFLHILGIRKDKFLSKIIKSTKEGNND
jgi:hypothetical protein